MRWTCHLTGGPRRVNHAAVSVGHLVFSFGGYCTGDNYKDAHMPIDVFVLNTRDLRWRHLSKPAPEDEESENWPFQRYGHTVAAYEDYIYLFGGRNDNTNCNTLYCFDTKTLKWSKPQVQGQIPVERDGHTSCVINHSMYVFGGYEEAQFRFGLELYRLDLRTLTWSMENCHGEPPIYRDFHSATAVGDLMFVFGGRSDLNGGWPGQMMANEFYTNKLHYLDTTTCTWYSPSIKHAHLIPEGRRSHSALNLNGKLLIFGGYNGRLNKHYNDLWIFDPQLNEWQELNPLSSSPDLIPNPRRRQAMCKVEEKIFLFGGTSPYDGPPIFFTPMQLQNIPDQDNDTARLIDHNDLYVLDLNPCLRTLCKVRIIELGLDVSELPKEIRTEISQMTKDNTISSALKILPLRS